MKLNEYELIEGGEYQEATNTFHGVKGLGLVSKNGYGYKGAAVQEAIKTGKYDRVVVYLDHKKGPRSYADRLGEFTNPQYEEGLKGDFKINPKHPMAETVIWDIQNKTHGVGFSHSIDGDLSKDKTMVEAINKVYSIDLVSGPATTKSFHEAEMDETAKLVESLQQEVESLKSDYSKIKESAHAEIVALKAELLLEIEKAKTYKKPESKPAPAPVSSGGYDDFVKRLKAS